jgi:hypothetical protein
MEHVKLIRYHVHKEPVASACREQNKIFVLFISCVNSSVPKASLCAVMLLITYVNSRFVYIVYIISELRYCVLECTAAVRKYLEAYWSS